MSVLLFLVAYVSMAVQDLPPRAFNPRLLPDVSLSADLQLEVARRQIDLLQAELANAQQQLAAARSELQMVQKRMDYQSFVDAQKKSAGKMACDITTEQEWVCAGK